MSSASLSEETIFQTARRLDSAEARRAYLDRACGEDQALRDQVEALLAAYDASGSFLESPADGIGAGRPTLDQELAIQERPGTVIGPYKLLEQIGEGGFGVVFMAEQERPVRRRVALKIIKPGMDTRQVIARFEAERQALAMMDHPNIAKVFDAGTTDTGRPYFVMEFVKGIPVTEYCDQQHLAPRDRLELFIPICQAVQHAHQKGIIHRDLKPSNILIALHDDVAVAKIIDFGVAKATGQRLTEKTMFTQYGQIVGTVEYMSPEQARFSQLDVDTRTDIYSLGVLLYELLTGETPFDRQRLRSAAFDEMLRVIREEEPPRPSIRLSTSESLPSIAANRQVEPRKLSALVHGELDWIVMKALEKERTRRYETASDFAEDVRHYLQDEPVEACPPSAGYRFRKFARRNKTVLTTAATIFLALLAGIVGTTWQAIRATHQRNRATVAEEQAVAEATRATKEAERANQQSQRATAEAQRAERQRRAAQQEQYDAEIVAGQSDLRANNISSLQRNLVSHLPLGDDPDLRDWEWYYLWSQCRPEERTLYHPSRWTTIDWSPDGKYIAVAGKVWEADSGKCIRVISPSWIATWRVSWSPDSRKLAWATTADDRGLYIWDRTTDTVQRIFHGIPPVEFPDANNIHGVAWSPDGRSIATSCYDGTIRIWDVQSSSLIKRLSSPRGANKLVWSPDGTRLAVTNNERQPYFSVWDPASGELLTVNNSVGSATSLAWDPQSKLLAVGTLTHVYLHAVDDWQVRAERESFDWVADLDWSSTGTQLAVAHGTKVTIYDSRLENEICEFRGRSHVRSVSWSPDEHRLASIADNGDIKIWNLQRKSQPTIVSTHRSIDDLDWLSDGETLIATDLASGVLSHWTLGGSTPHHVETGVPEGLRAFSPDRRLAAVGLQSDDDHSIRIIDVETGGEKCVIPMERSHDVRSLSFSPDGTRLAVVTRFERTLVLGFYDLPHGHLISRWTHYDWANWGRFGTESLRWSPDGRHLAIVALGDHADNGGVRNQFHLHVVRVEDGQRVLKRRPAGGNLIKGGVRSLAWTDDSSRIAIGATSGSVEVLDLRTRRVVVSNGTFTSPMFSLAWKPGNQRLACGAMNGLVKICSADDCQALLTFDVSKGYATHLVWSPDGKKLAANTEQGDILVWDASRGYEYSSGGARRNDLAIDYFQISKRSFRPYNRAALRKFLELIPDELGYWWFRGLAYGCVGEFDKSAKEFAKGIGPDLRYSHACAYVRAEALLGAGNLEAYREACASIVDAFGSSDVASNKIRVAWLCSLSPEPPIETQQILQIVREGVNDPSPDYSTGDIALLALAASQYRDGHFEDAARLLEDLVSHNRGGDLLDQHEGACSQYFLAMALHKLNDDFQAAESLEEANNQAANLKQMNPSWYYTVVIDALRREAEALIGTDNSEKAERETDAAGNQSNPEETPS